MDVIKLKNIILMVDITYVRMFINLRTIVREQWNRRDDDEK